MIFLYPSDGGKNIFRSPFIETLIGSVPPISSVGGVIWPWSEWALEGTRGLFRRVIIGSLFRRLGPLRNSGRIGAISSLSESEPSYVTLFLKAEIKKVFWLANIFRKWLKPLTSRPSFVHIILAFWIFKTWKKKTEISWGILVDKW